ncbi:MAG: hypothetical protein Q8L10_00170 [Candidatus Moranbacteria bacterium]|nr:hypothetical protein [Candidatus Moranbacteria bacterium]
MKKFFRVVSVFALAVAMMFPAVSLAADQWGFGIGSGGVSGGYSGSSGSFGFNVGNSSGIGSGWNPGNLSGFGLPEGSITGIIVNILDWLLFIFGLLGIIGFLISGIMYILASGNDDMIEKAKSGMKFSIIGVLVGLSGVVIIRAIDAILATGYTI